MSSPKPLTFKDLRLPEPNIRRDLLDRIEPWLEKEEVIALIGARQTGKTTLLHQLIQEFLLPKGSPIYYFNLDFSEQQDFFETPDALIDLITDQESFSYVIIDEVQRLTNPGLTLKRIYDLKLPVKLIISGSSSLEIKAKTQEALTGRKVVFHVHPFNNQELVRALGEDIFSSKVLEHLVIYGGYPAVATEKDEQLKKKRLEEIFQSYLEKDVADFLRVENLAAFSKLVTLLASQVGNLVNKTELSNSLGIHLNTLDNYLYYLEQTFILELITPFYRNKKKELLKMPKAYFFDLGLRNFAVRSFSSLKLRQDKGVLLENFGFLTLKSKLAPVTPLHFWRTKMGAEVDFVIEDGLEPIPIEVKASRLSEPKISRSFRSFLKTYSSKQAYYLNLGLNTEEIFENVSVNFCTPEKFSKIEFVKDE